MALATFGVATLYVTKEEMPPLRWILAERREFAVYLSRVGYLTLTHGLNTQIMQSYRN
jgi:hypothetical protein